MYYGILQTLSSIEALNVTLQSYRELDRLVTDYGGSTSLKVDSLEVKTRLAKAEYDLPHAAPYAGHSRSSSIT